MDLCLIYLIDDKNRQKHHCDGNKKRKKAGWEECLNSNNTRQQSLILKSLCVMGFYGFLLKCSFVCTCVGEFVSSCFPGERDYDETLFHNRVERIFIDDHNVPTIK